jgi:hypothetical protein
MIGCSGRWRPDLVSAYNGTGRPIFPVRTPPPPSPVRARHRWHLLRTAGRRSPILLSARVTRAAVPQSRACAAAGLLLGRVPPPRLRFFPSRVLPSPLPVQPPHVTPFPPPQVTAMLPSPSSSRAHRSESRQVMASSTIYPWCRVGEDRRCFPC